MAHSFPSSQPSLTGFLSGSLQEPSPLSAYSILGPSSYPESVALWHNPSAPPLPPQPPSSQPGLAGPTPPGAYPSAPKPSPLLQTAADQKKHKRTRSGCFTCRARRIKCDESRPVCDRCRKGSRDCVYPPPGATGSASKSASRSAAKPKSARPQSHGSDSSGLVEHEDVRALETIADEEEEEGSVGSPSTGVGASRAKPGLPRKHSTQSLRKRQVKQQPTPSTTTAETPTSIKEASSSPSTEASSRFESTSARSASVSFYPVDAYGLPSTTHLPEDLQFYLAFYQEFITYRHFFLRLNSDYFVHHSVIELALQYEPLLYAVVGFAAYHHCVQTGSGKLYTFLKYYNAALKMLRKSLGSGEAHNEATLITVLVLTTFEEFVGDWVNLIDHHQAAHALVREILTPESITTNELHDHIFLWYARFDVVAGILAGNEAVLGREWYLAKEQHDEQQAAAYPDDAEKQLALSASINRRFGLEMASLYAKLSRGMIPFDEFMVQNEQLGQVIERIRVILERFTDSEYTVWEHPDRQPLTENDIVDPYVPALLQSGPLWDVNVAWIDYYSTKQMYKYQSLLSVKQSSMEELESLSARQCQLIEAIARWPDKENGWMYSFKNSVGMVALFGRKDEKHLMWSRRKLALMEQNGYAIAPKFRELLATVFQQPELNRWWLPNDEGYPEIIREVRAMTEERTTNPRDNFRESVRDMRSLFWNISLDDTESEPSPASTTGTGTENR